MRIFAIVRALQNPFHIRSHPQPHSMTHFKKRLRDALTTPIKIETERNSPPYPAIGTRL